MDALKTSLESADLVDLGDSDEDVEPADCEGSGLFDLTRESDDTSLGAELLDAIHPGDDGAQEAENASSSSALSPHKSKQWSGSVWTKSNQ